MSRFDVIYGEGALSEALEAAGDYALVTMEEPLSLLEGALKNRPAALILNRDMSIGNLERLERAGPRADRIVGFGGGTACDTAKYLAWKWELPLIVAPSIVSVDAWLCRSVAVRVDGKVRYVGDAAPEKFIVDFGIIRQAPPELNRAGIADVISIATALGDWIIARDVFGEKFDQSVFDAAKSIADELMRHASDIRDVTEAGIRAIVDGQIAEVELCERWGSARPEEGSEHFLAYRLEEITRGHYIHGDLIALNSLVVLKLQRGRAVFDAGAMKKFFDDAGINFAPLKQGISRADYRLALETAGEYVRRENLFKGLWWLDDIFIPDGEFSIEGILDWIFSL